MEKLTTVSTDASEQDAPHFVTFPNGTVLPVENFTKVRDSEGEITHWEYTDHIAHIRYIVWND
jgi:hypothetical protein